MTFNMSTVKEMIFKKFELRANHEPRPKNYNILMVFIFRYNFTSVEDALQLAMIYFHICMRSFS